MNVHFMDSPDGDWVAMYIDGKIAMQGHSLCRVAIVEALRDAGLDIAVSQSEMTTSAQESGYVPDNLDDPCPHCGQVPNGQGGEFPCPLCGLPWVHDDEGDPAA